MHAFLLLNRGRLMYRRHFKYLTLGERRFRHLIIKVERFLKSTVYELLNQTIIMKLDFGLRRMDIHIDFIRRQLQK